MGYDVHITRAESWLDSQDNPITLDEWQGYVQQDPEMRLDGVAVARVKGKPALAVGGPGIAVWVAWPGHDERGNMAWFHHWHGRVIVKNLDDAILAKMKSVAESLRANVVGDDGEFYHRRPPDRRAKKRR